MHNKNRLYDEVSRMIELFESDSKKSNFLKNSFKEKISKKTNLKEALDIGDLDIFGDKSDEEANKKIKSEFDSHSASDDISLLNKLGLTSRSMNTLQKNLFDLEKKDFLNIQDLRTKAVRTSDEGAAVSKWRKDLYSQMSASEFKDLLRKGRFVLKIGSNSDEVEPNQAEKLYKWLDTKSFNAIGLNTSGKVSKEGNATLNFLGRIVSGEGLKEDEQKIMSAFGEGARNSAGKILYDWYKLVSENILLDLLNMKPTPENLDIISEGVNKAMRELVEGKWNPSQNLSPWFLQVVKNHAKNELKKITQYVPDLDSAARIFDDMMSKDGVISIVSRKDPSHKNLADEVEDMGDKKYIYKYSSTEDALNDLKDSMTVKNHHMKPYNLLISKSKDLFSSERQAPSYMDPEEIASMQIGDVSIKDFDGGAQDEIKDILGDAVEFMSSAENFIGTEELLGKEIKKPRAVSAKQHSTESKPDSKSAKAAKSNLVNFLYNFVLPTLLNSVGKTVTKEVEDTNPNSPTYGQTIRVVDTSRTERDPSNKAIEAVRDVEESGNISANVMNTWIDSQNKKIMDSLKKIRPEQSEEELEKLAKEKGLLIKGNAQDLWNGLKVFLAKSPSVFKKITELILQTSAKGYEEELSKDSLEERIRAKIQKILKESFILKENEEVEQEVLDVEDLDNQIKIFGDRFSKATTYDQEKLNNEVKNVVNGEMSKWTFENGFDGQHNYVTSILASLYNSLNKVQQDNIVKYIFLSFFPYGDKSKIIGLMSEKITGNRDALRDLIWNSLMEPESNNKILFVNALEKYEPKGSFYKFLNRRLRNSVSNALKGSEESYSEKTLDDAPEWGQYTSDKDLEGAGDIVSKRKRVQKAYIDAPATDDNSGRAAFELESEPTINDRKEKAKHTLSRVLSTLGSELSKSQRNLLMAIKDMGDDAFSPDGELVYGLIATRTGLSDSNVGSTMSAIKKMAKELKGKGTV